MGRYSMGVLELVPIRIRLGLFWEYKVQLHAGTRLLPGYDIALIRQEVTLLPETPI